MTISAGGTRATDPTAPPIRSSFVRRHASTLTSALVGLIVALIAGFLMINPLRSENPEKVHGTVVSTKEHVSYHSCGKHSTCKHTSFTTKVQLAGKTVTVDESDRIGDASPVVVWRVGSDYSSTNPKSPGQIIGRIVLAIVFGFVASLIVTSAIFFLGKWRESRRLGESFF